MLALGVRSCGMPATFQKSPALALKQSTEKEAHPNDLSKKDQHQALCEGGGGDFFLFVREKKRKKTKTKTKHQHRVVSIRIRNVVSHKKIRIPS